MNKPSSIWTNPLTFVLLFLALIWIFTVAKFCKNSKNTAANTDVPKVESPVSGYALLPETHCPLKLVEGDDELAAALLRQYFRMDSLNRFQEALWQPDAKLDAAFAQLYQGTWETYIECIQTLQGDTIGTAEKIAILASNFVDNDCQACAPYIGYIRFSMERGDPSTIVIRNSERALFTFGAYGAIGDQISLVQLGPYHALAFSNASNGQGRTLGHTTLYKLDDFRPLLTVDNYESNGDTDEPYLYERKGDLYFQQGADTQSPPGLALYQSTTVLSGNAEKVPAPEVMYFEYVPDSLRYVKID